MKTRFAAMLLIVGLSAALAAAQDDIRTVPRISVDDVKTLMAKKQVVLIDVRDPMSFSEGHMPGAINVPFDFLPDILPVLGFTDDAAVLATAIRMVASNITPEHREAARAALKRGLPDAET